MLFVVVTYVLHYKNHECYQSYLIVLPQLS